MKNDIQLNLVWSLFNYIFIFESVCLIYLSVCDRKIQKNLRILPVTL